MLYTYQTRTGKIGIATASDLRRGSITGVGLHPNYGKITKNFLTVFALRQQGMSLRRIATLLGVQEVAVYAFFKRHAADYAAYTAVMAALPPGEEFLTGT
jgi:hypothetical protein